MNLEKSIAISVIGSTQERSVIYGCSNPLNLFSGFFFGGGGRCLFICCLFFVVFIIANP